MSRITLGALAILLATGAAFARYDNQPVATVDHAYTASIRAFGTSPQHGVDTTGPSQSVLVTVARHNSDDIWGR